jgi:hypothetical protein
VNRGLDVLGSVRERCDRATLGPLTKRQQSQPFMVNALLSVVVYFLLRWHRVTMPFQVA